MLSFLSLRDPILIKLHLGLSLHKTFSQTPRTVNILIILAWFQDLKETHQALI